MGSEWFRLIGVILLVFSPLFLTGCGFKPLYAVDGADGTQSLADVNLQNVFGDRNAVTSVTEALRYRTAVGAGSAKYDLVIKTEEAAARLGIQLDASVTRFNYRLIGEYKLTDRETGRVISGSSRANASFNVVNSQYATLAAERDARRKAANTLVNLLERKILLELGKPLPQTGETEDNSNDKPLDFEDNNIEEGYFESDPQGVSGIDYIDGSFGDTNDTIQPQPME